jgi:hypothetical protein
MEDGKAVDRPHQVSVRYRHLNTTGFSFHVCLITPTNIHDWAQIEPRQINGQEKFNCMSELMEQFCPSVNMEKYDTQPSTAPHL